MTTREALAYVLSGESDSDAALDLADDIIKGLESQGLAILPAETIAIPI